MRIVDQAAITDVGRQRSANEDAFYGSAPVFAVADGMGGARAGEVASSAAVEELGAAGDGAGLTERDLARLVERANSRIHELSRGDEALAGMGTTMTAAVVRDREIAIAHVGDSRMYRLRAAKLEKLTHDHSLVDEMVRAGKLTPEEAEVHPQRSIITRALGPEPDVEVERLTYPTQPGDVYLICSDGLTTMLPEDAVGSILRAHSSLEQAAADLVRAANEAGGRDNITVVLFKLDDDDDAGQADQATMVGGSPAALKTEEVQAAATAAAAPDPKPASEATMVFDDAQRAKLREAQRPTPSPRRRPKLRAFVTAVVVTVVACAVAVGFWAGSRQFYFVGTDEQGLVTVYRGLPYELPLGLELWEKEYSSAVPASLIPDSRRERILDHRLRGRGDALDLVKQVERGELEG